MFLNNLNNEQKNLFLELAIKAAEISRGMSLEEKNMLKEFALEMMITPKYETIKSSEEIIKRLTEISSKKDLRIITFEILGIMYSDSNYDETEKDFVFSIANAFGITKESVIDMDSAIKKYSELYSEICNLVLQQ